MRNETIRRAYDSVLPDAEAKERMLQNILSEASNARPEGNVVKMRKKSIKKGAIIILAAALALALSVVALAYATDLFGFRALARPEPEGGYADGFPISEGEAVISITQPQDVPDEVDAKFETNIAEKLEKSRLAWEEWQDSRHELHAEYDAFMEKYEIEEEYGGIEDIDNGDGTVTWEYRDLIDGEWVVVDMRVFTEQEIQEYFDFLHSWQFYESGYDFNYGVCSDAQKAKLEEIAEKYGLKLRGNGTYMYSSEGASGMTGDGFYTNEELVEIISDVACSGRLFDDTPSDFDKAYYFDEGTFAMDWRADLPDGGQAWCYGYNSMYGTLSSGSEIYMITDTEGFTERTHTCPDGTEVTILSNGGDEAFIYVYLENSFFAESINSTGPLLICKDNLTDADLDYIADNINYSVIGK